MTPGDPPSAPLCSVGALIPVYNGGALVEEALRSVTAQDWPPAEILLIDDGSKDDSFERLNGLQRAFPGIRLASNGTNLGLSATLNRGLQLLTSDLVLVLHQDCRLLGTDWIRRGAAQFDDPRVIATLGTPRHVVEEMAPLERDFWVIRHHTVRQGQSTIPPDDHSLFSENKADLFRRRELLALGGFDPRMREGGEDQVLSWRLKNSPFILRRTPELPFAIRLGPGEGVGRHLRKEASYGRQIRQVLTVTRGGAVRKSSSGAIDVRLLNRAAGVLWELATVTGLGLWVWLRSPWLLLVVGVPPLLRWLQFTIRAVGERTAYRLRWRDIVSIGPLGLLADLAYAIGIITPFRRDGRSAPVSSAS